MVHSDGKEVCPSGALRPPGALFGDTSHSGFPLERGNAGECHRNAPATRTGRHEDRQSRAQSVPRGAKLLKKAPPEGGGVQPPLGPPRSLPF